MIDIYSIFGWVGMILIVVAYFLLASKKTRPNSFLYNTLNLFGGVCLVISTLATKSWPVMTLNCIWILIAIFSIIKNFIKGKKK